MPVVKLPKPLLIVAWPCLFLIIFSSLWSTSAQALAPTKALTQYVREVWQQEEGLPENDVTGIVQTRDGYLWLGTEEGLVRFDGIHFTVFDKSNSPELTSIYIRTLCEGHDGSLWIGTEGGGVYRLKDGKLNACPTEDGLSNDDIRSLYESDDGSLWIGTDGHGLGRLKKGKFSRYTTKEGLSDDFVWALEGTEDGSLWIGTNHGLNRLKDGKVKPIVQSQLLDAILNVLGTKAQPADQPPPLVTRHSLSEGMRSLRVLLAEDNAVNQLLASRLLEKHGHSVVLASNGRKALEALEKQKFDLVVMDVSMPEMDGYEAVAAIRRKEGATGCHIPIVAMTAHAMKGDRERCLAAGMDAYVSKPLRASELFEVIKTLPVVPP
jgi:CheY-like chemotaxis protein